MLFVNEFLHFFFFGLLNVIQVVNCCLSLICQILFVVQFELMILLLHVFT